MSNRFVRSGLLIGAALACIVLGSVLLVRNMYNDALEPVSNSQNIVLITVPSGSTESEIADNLKQNGIIKESWAFEWYVRNQGLNGQLKAGVYAMNPSLGVDKVVKILVHGEEATDLVTILPGRRIDQIEADLINSGFAPEDVKSALQPENYANHPALVDKPKSASLEGYLYPESFQKTNATKAADIILASLNQMQKRLTPELRAGIAKQGLSVHEGVILASIIEQEVPDSQDRKTVAQVFLKRLNDGMKLESDATAPYGAVLAGEEPSLTYDSQYNTYLYGGLPPGPISNVSQSSLAAVANPSKTNYVYFVSGDDGTTHFSKTLEEHEANVERFCTKLCNQ